MCPRVFGFADSQRYKPGGCGEERLEVDLALEQEVLLSVIINSSEIFGGSLGWTSRRFCLNDPGGKF